MIKPLELTRRIEEIKEILDLQDDNIIIGWIPDKFCDVEPYCDYKALYQKENNAILIHPDSLSIYDLSEMTAIVAHELYHAYQYKTEPELYDTQKKQNYCVVGMDYVKQPLEMQAYAFQDAIIMLYEEVCVKFELEGVDEKTRGEIDILAEEYYKKYADKFIEVVRRKQIN
ncbi:MAG: hypothetical protein J6W25_03820 [Bacilli bacterium]|nr:hypothetical protein [Bacilli bacterium]MBO7535844.1 hypothetical protein [Bacilli bacterium]